jgi:hypothetical protein
MAFEKPKENPEATTDKVEVKPKAKAKPIPEVPWSAIIEDSRRARKALAKAKSDK